MTWWMGEESFNTRQRAFEAPSVVVHVYVGKESGSMQALEILLEDLGGGCAGSGTTTTTIPSTRLVVDLRVVVEHERWEQVQAVVERGIERWACGIATSRSDARFLAEGLLRSVEEDSRDMNNAGHLFLTTLEIRVSRHLFAWFDAVHRVWEHDMRVGAAVGHALDRAVVEEAVEEGGGETPKFDVVLCADSGRAQSLWAPRPLWLAFGAQRRAIEPKSGVSTQVQAESFALRLAQFLATRGEAILSPWQESGRRAYVSPIISRDRGVDVMSAELAVSGDMILPDPSAALCLDSNRWGSLNCSRAARGNLIPGTYNDHVVFHVLAREKPAALGNLMASLRRTRAHTRMRIDLVIDVDMLLDGGTHHPAVLGIVEDMTWALGEKRVRIRDEMRTPNEAWIEAWDPHHLDESLHETKETIHVVFDEEVVVAPWIASWYVAAHRRFTNDPSVPAITAKNALYVARGVATPETMVQLYASLRVPVSVVKFRLASVLGVSFKREAWAAFREWFKVKSSDLRFAPYVYRPWISPNDEYKAVRSQKDHLRASTYSMYLIKWLDERSLYMVHPIVKEGRTELIQNHHHDGMESVPRGGPLRTELHPDPFEDISVHVPCVTWDGSIEYCRRGIGYGRS